MCRFFLAAVDEESRATCIKYFTAAMNSATWAHDQPDHDVDWDHDDDANEEKEISRMPKIRRSSCRRSIIIVTDLEQVVLQEDQTNTVCKLIELRNEENLNSARNLDQHAKRLNVIIRLCLLLILFVNLLIAIVCLCSSNI